jgi:hypothetical protein
MRRRRALPPARAPEPAQERAAFDATVPRTRCRVRAAEEAAPGANQTVDQICRSVICRRVNGATNKSRALPESASTVRRTRSVSNRFGRTEIALLPFTEIRGPASDPPTDCRTSGFRRAVHGLIGKRRPRRSDPPNTGWRPRMSRGRRSSRRRDRMHSAHSNRRASIGFIRAALRAG